MEQYIEFAVRQWLLFVALAAVVAALIVNEVWGAIKGGGSIAPTEAVNLINREDALVVDVRPKGDYRKGHILNAKNIPRAQLDERMKDLESARARPLIVYCANGTAAPSIRDKLRGRGFAKVVSLKGGLSAWQAAGLPVSGK